MRMIVSIATAVLLATVAGPARAHLAAGTVTLTPDEEVPAPTGVPEGAGGTAELELEDDNTLVYSLTVQNLTGPAQLAHIHEGAPGVPGDIVIGLTKTSDTSFAGTTRALTADEVSKLLSGAYYLNVHTSVNGAGEIRGQITTVVPARGICSCKTLSKKDFRACVRGEIKKLDKSQKKSAEVKALKKAANKALCGGTPAPGKKQLACCLPANDVAGIVTGQLCQPIKKETQCKGGTFVSSPCAPTNPCPQPASPSGAFID